ncbi:hypothetical protein [Actinosynnema sp. NPDC020468]|uniref:hypothetical protein n=1 Tax=Actinosynnema sp. NPDC020468 TaxID=3154488 RepID=UPI0034034864
MAKYRWHEHDFITEVATRRGYHLTGGRSSPWRLSGGTPGSSWTTTLTPASGELPASILWRCPDLRASPTDPTRQLVVEPRSSTPTLRSLFGRKPLPEPPGILGPLWTVNDPSRVLDPSLTPWFAHWPPAWWGPNDTRPATLGSLWLNQYGLDLQSQDWWCSAPALDQLINLGVDIAGRLRRAGF